jgi:hypothetical protein
MSRAIMRFVKPLYKIILKMSEKRGSKEKQMKGRQRMKGRSK